MPSTTEHQIVVTGDLLWDCHLRYDPGQSDRHTHPCDLTMIDVQPGGAWYLTRLIKNVCSSLTKRTDSVNSFVVYCPENEQVNRPQLADSAKEDPSKFKDAPLHSWNQVGKAFMTWKSFDRRRNQSKDELVWRIDNFLGCQQPEKYESLPLFSCLPEQTTDEQVKQSEKKGTKKKPKENPQKLSSLSGSRLLVIDDLCLGFTEHPNLWPKLKPGQKDWGDQKILQKNLPKDILLKLSCLDDKNLLFHRLLDAGVGDRITAVVSADILRTRGADLSKGLSWDRTVSEIVKEFQSGFSQNDLAMCKRVIVYFGCAGIASFTLDTLKLGDPKQIEKQTDDSRTRTERARFERFVYAPDDLEGSWESQRPGRMVGAGSILTAAMVRYILEPEQHTLFSCLSRALEAMRHNYDIAGDKGDQPTPDTTGIQQILDDPSPEDEEDDKTMVQKAEKSKPDKEKRERPEAKYSSAFPHVVFSRDQHKNIPDDKLDLLQDVAGYGIDYITARAMDVVRRGAEVALAQIPQARYGKYLTVDREEIERINSVRRLIEEYLNSPEDRRPLSIAVFGPPGSGKSFAIKQLAEELLGKKGIKLEFNLSQFDASNHMQLHEAFHQIRDASIKDTVPLVFWDEFDTDNVNWLKHFLAPMQDSEFLSGNLLHPFGKAIFIFAGGTCQTFEEFNISAAVDDESDSESTEFVKQKGPDFVSRLRGFINIKGPNPIIDLKGESEDIAYPLRRALILRSLLERDYPHLIHRKSKMASVSPSVIYGFLRVKQFLHGARSLESVVRISSLLKADYFSMAQLPSEEQLLLHVSEDFKEIMQQAHLEPDTIEAIAKTYHTVWRDSVNPDPTDEDKQNNPALNDYEDLPEKNKEDNRKPARVVFAKLAEIGYALDHHTKNPRSECPFEFPDEDALALTLIEHDVWIRNQMVSGFEWSPEKNKERFQHPDICTFKEVPPDDQQHDKNFVECLPGVLWNHRIQIRKIKSTVEAAHIDP
ncbi:AAA family ATPase [Gimesia maris]|uniref:AAA family ATPase n=1 Tax=Gimesia maris TaxID=122 RepID=UPI0030DC2E60